MSTNTQVETISTGADKAKLAAAGLKLVEQAELNKAAKELKLEERVLKSDLGQLLLRLDVEVDGGNEAFDVAGWLALWSDDGQFDSGHVRARGTSELRAFIAAHALEVGATLVSADRGFAGYPGLRWRHPADLDR